MATVVEAIRIPRASRWALAAIALGVATMTLPAVVAEWSSSGRVTIAGLTEIVSRGIRHLGLVGRRRPHLTTL